jgi:hypothetical protein
MFNDKGKLQMTNNSRSSQHSTKRKEQRISKKQQGKPNKGAKQHHIHADEGIAADIADLSMLPRLFELWDDDNSGTICKKELFAGLRSFCKEKRIELDWDHCRWLFSDVDTDNSGDLDLREFSLFVSKVAHGIGSSEESFAYFMVERLSTRKSKKPAMMTIPPPVQTKLLREVDIKPKNSSHSPSDETKMTKLGLADVIVQLWYGLQEEMTHESLEGVFIKEVGSRGA